MYISIRFCWEKQKYVGGVLEENQKISMGKIKKWREVIKRKDKKSESITHTLWLMEKRFGGKPLSLTVQAVSRIKQNLHLLLNLRDVSQLKVT